MIKSRFLLLLSFIFIAFGCANKKNVLYMQNDDKVINYSLTYNTYKIKTDDILKISVSIDDKEIMTSLINSQNNLSETRESLTFKGFQVNTQGFINYELLGDIYVAEKTIDQVREIIKSQIISKGFYNNPIVEVRLINANFTILGEVKNPGNYNFQKNNLNILEAIGIAGDLTINGVRENVKLIRYSNGKQKIFNIDLTNTNILADKNFQIFSGDIIIVNPNTNRIKNAGIIGNSGTLLTLLSFILSSIIVINN